MTEEGDEIVIIKCDDGHIVRDIIRGIFDFGEPVLYGVGDDTFLYR